MKCKRCKYFERVDDCFQSDGTMYSWHYECRKNAPISNNEGLGIWPRIDEDDWCGNFKSATKQI